MNIQIGTDNVDSFGWSDFVLNHPNGNIFQTLETFELYSRSEFFEPVILFALENNKICGVLLAVIQKEYKGIFGKLTARSIIFGGPLVYDPEVAYAILSEYNKIVKRKVIYSQFRNIFPVDNIRVLFEKAGYKYEEHLDVLIDLRKGENLLWEEIHKNRKKEIKSGLKKGLEVSLISLQNEPVLPELYQMLKLLYNKIGLPVPLFDFFREAVSTFEQSGLLKTFIAQVNNKIVGFRMVLTFKKIIYDWYAASDNEYLNYRPNDVLPWEIFKWGVNNSYGVFDFGGAGKPQVPYGVRDYKIKFGGELVNYGRFQKIHNVPVYYMAIMALPFYKLVKHAKL